MSGDANRGIRHELADSHDGRMSRGRPQRGDGSYRCGEGCGCMCRCLLAPAFLISRSVFMVPEAFDDEDHG